MKHVVHAMAAFAVTSLVVTAGAAASNRSDGGAAPGRGSITTITPSVGDVFDWFDAAVGGASVIGVGLVGIGTALVLRRRKVVDSER